MEIILGVVIGLIISWIFAWVIQPLLFKDKTSVEARFARIERYLAQADSRLQTLEGSSAAHTAYLQSLTGANLTSGSRIKAKSTRFRRIQFRQVMGVVFILKPFMPLILLATFGFIGYQMVNDVRNDPIINGTISQVTNNLQIVQTEIESLGDVLDKLKGDFAWVEDVLGVIGDILRAIGAVINVIIDAINAIPGIDISRLNIDIPGIRNISKSIEDLTAIFEAIKDIIPDIEPVIVSLKTIFFKWWGYTKLLVALLLGWLILAILSNGYSNIQRGLNLIRSRPTVLLVPGASPSPPKATKKGLLKSQD